MRIVKPTPDYQKILESRGMPTNAEQVSSEFNELVRSEGLITNTSRMSPFWRLINAITIKPFLWLKDALINVVMKNMFLATAEGIFLDLFAWSVNINRKDAVKAVGKVLFIKQKDSINQELLIKAGTVIQTERINGLIYRLVVVSDQIISAGQPAALVNVEAENSGTAYNLAPGYYRILPEKITGIDSVETTDDWLISPGSDVETDDEIRDRIRNQYNVVGQYHVDAVYRGMIASIAGLTTDRIYFEHDAPRGAGTANVYLLLDTGTLSQPFIDKVNDYVMKKGNHGHGDDVLCLALPETFHDISVKLHIFDISNKTAEMINVITLDVENIIRCAFRENTVYDVQKTWPFERFSISRLDQDIHNLARDVESLEFSITDITSDLSVPRIKSLAINVVGYE